MKPQIESLKKLFTWEKFHQTLAFYWSLYWRCLLLIAPVFIPIISIYMFQADILSSPFLSYCVIGLCIVLVLLMFPLIAYGHYYPITFKTYKSFDKVFLKGEFSRFWSWDFWKVFLKFCGFYTLAYIPILMADMIIKFFTNEIYILLFFMSLLGFALALTMYHIALHKGFFGFIPVSKKK